MNSRAQKRVRTVRITLPDLIAPLGMCTNCYKAKLTPLLSSPLFVFQPKEQRKGLSVWNKLSYAIGGAPYQITGSALGFFLQIYLLDVAQVIDNRHTNRAKAHMHV